MLLQASDIPLPQIHLNEGKFHMMKDKMQDGEFKLVVKRAQLHLLQVHLIDWLLTEMKYDDFLFTAVSTNDGVRGNFTSRAADQESVVQFRTAESTPIWRAHGRDQLLDGKPYV